MIRNSGRLTRGFLYLAIEARGRLVGGIDARTRPKFMLPEGVFELGVELYSPDDRGLGLGSEALALLVTYLFGEAEARRIQAATSVDNEAMRRVLEKAGFAEEGVLREYVAGADYVMCSITRGTAE